MNVKEFMETQKNSNEIEKEVYESHICFFFLELLIFFCGDSKEE